jgi:hypothetical protein
VAINCLSRLSGGGNPAASLGSVLGASSTSATVTGSKTVTQSQAPHLSATVLTNLLAVAPQNLTVSQLGILIDALSRVSSGGVPSATVGSLLR